MKTNRNVILAIDEGTSGTRAAVVAADGHVSCLEYTMLQVDAPRPGVVEQDANAILEKTIAVCRATIARAQQEQLRIVALGIATQRATAVLWDTRSGRAIVPAMVWQDTRYVSELSALAPAWDKTLIEQVGRPVGVRSPYLWAARHLRDTPEVAEAFRAGSLGFGTIDTWLLWHLSTERACVTTPTNVTSASAYVLAEHRYHLGWLDALEFPHSLLPALRQDADDFGRTRPEQLGIDVPILACAGDQLAGAAGLGCLERGQSMCVHGTGSFVDLVIGPEPPAKAGLYDGTLTMTARRQFDVSHLSVETFVATTGSALNWVCEKLRWFESARQISALAATVDSARRDLPARAHRAACPADAARSPRIADRHLHGEHAGRGGLRHPGRHRACRVVVHGGQRGSRRRARVRTHRGRRALRQRRIAADPGRPDRHADPAHARDRSRQLARHRLLRGLVGAAVGLAARRPRHQ